jgi:hypothetical protein
VRLTESPKIKRQLVVQCNVDVLALSGSRFLRSTAFRHAFPSQFYPKIYLLLPFSINSITSDGKSSIRLKTIGIALAERVLDGLSFEASDMRGQQMTIDAAYVQRVLADIIKDEDLSRYVL